MRYGSPRRLERYKVIRALLAGLTGNAYLMLLSCGLTLTDWRSQSGCGRGNSRGIGRGNAVHCRRRANNVAIGSEDIVNL